MPSNLQLFIPRAEIQTIVGDLARRIDRDYAGQSLTAIVILQGAFIFAADLLRALQTPVDRLEFMQLSSYGAGTISSRQVEILSRVPEDRIADRPILVIEDIVDTGRSMATLLPQLQACGPRSLKLCTLLDKPSRRQVEVTVDYAGKTIGDRYVVGYGFDCDGKYRQLPDIYYQLD